MNDDQRPYLARCGFCEQGLLRFMRCPSCGGVLAVCDECELVWADLAAVSADPSTPAATAWPYCPICQTSHAHWGHLDREEIERAGLTRFVSGQSV